MTDTGAWLESLPAYQDERDPEGVEIRDREAEARFGEAPKGATMKRVEITRRMIPEMGIFGIITMQVCAASDATDEEILEVCNRENPAGTSCGWSEVVREVDEESPWRNENKLPVPCVDNPDRTHFLVLC